MSAREETLPANTGKALARTVAEAERMLALLGWSVLELDVDITAGTGRATFRSGSGRRVEVVASERGTYLERLQERPEIAAPKDWRCTSATPLPVLLGRSKVPSLPVAMRDAVRYMTDNVDRPLPREALAKMQRYLGRMLSDAVARSPRELGPRPRPGDQPDPGPLTSEWLAECEASCCHGDDPGPMVRSQGRLAVGRVRGYAASGLIIDGRGRDGSAQFEVIAWGGCLP